MLDGVDFLMYPRGRVGSSRLTSFSPLLELVYYDMERCHGNGLKWLREG